MRVDDDPIDDETNRLLQRTIDAVRDRHGRDGLQHRDRALFELNNHLTQVVQQRGSAPREVVTPMVLMVAPLAPHIAEELWARTGHAETLAYESFPTADPALLVDDAVEVPVQIGGKVRSRGSRCPWAPTTPRTNSSRAWTPASPTCSTAPRCGRSSSCPAASSTSSSSYRNGANVARISSEKICGSSQAAKWPPRAALLK